LRACPLPQAAAAIATLEKIDPEAVRRAATLAAFAGALGAKPGDTASAPTSTPPASAEIDGQDGDPGDPTMARTAAPAPAATAPAGAPEAAIAARIPAVLADEEATDDAPGIDPSRPEAASRMPSPPSPAAAGSEANGQSKIVKWVIWAAVVLLIAIFSRSRLRATGAGPSVR